MIPLISSELSHFRHEDGLKIANLFGSNYRALPSYRSGTRFSLRDKDSLLTNTLSFTLDGSVCFFSVGFQDSRNFSPIIDVLNNHFPIDFKLYNSIILKAASVYSENSFFYSNFTSPLTVDSDWSQFLPSKNKVSVSCNFSKTLKMVYNSFQSRDARMLLKHQLCFVKYKSDCDSFIFVPAIKFTLPVSKISERVMLVSLSPTYDFIYCIDNKKQKVIEKNSVDVFISQLNSSILTHIYNNLNKSIDMSTVTLKEFKELAITERDDYVQIGRMVKI